jgi:hypothetical protein
MKREITYNMSTKKKPRKTGQNEKAKGGVEERRLPA